MTDQQGGIRIGDLLVRAGVVTAEDCAEAERLSAEMKAQFGRLLILAGCLTEEALACALEAQAFIKQGVISFDIAIEALAFAVSENMSLEQALELLDLLPQFGTATLELAKLVGEARIVPEDALIEALEHSVQTNIPLSEVLLAEQLISADMLGLMNVLHEQIRTNSLDRGLAVKDLRAEYAGWRRGNYSNKSSRNKMPAYPQAQEVRKTFHQMKAMMPVQPTAPQAPQPTAPSVYDFNQPAPKPVAPQAVPVSQSAQAFKGFSAEKDDTSEDEKAKSLDLDKLKLLKSLAFAGPVGAPLPLLIDDALPAVPIAALQSADHWNSLDASPASSFSKQAAPPPSPGQPAFNPFGSGPDFYSESPVPQAPAAPQAFHAPAPPPAPMARPVEPLFEVPPAREVQAKFEPIPLYDLPPEPVLKSGSDSWDWKSGNSSPPETASASPPASTPAPSAPSASDEDGLDWSWAPSPEELEEAERTPTRFAWEDDTADESVAIPVADAPQQEQPFVWASEPSKAISEASAPEFSTEKPRSPENEVDISTAKDDAILPPADTVDSGKFIWVSNPDHLNVAKREGPTYLPPIEEDMPPSVILSAEESIAALAEATMSAQFADSDTPAALEMSSSFKWEPTEYAAPTETPATFVTDTNERLDSLDIESEIKEQPKAASVTPLSLNFERSSFGSKDNKESKNREEETVRNLSESQAASKLEEDTKTAEKARLEKENAAAAKREQEKESAAKAELEQRLVAEAKTTGELKDKLAAEIKFRGELEARLESESKAKLELEEKFAAGAKDKAKLEEKLATARIELVNKLASEAKSKVHLQEKLEAEEKAKTELEEKLAADSKEKAALEEKIAALEKAKAESDEQAAAATTATPAFVSPAGKKGKKKGKGGSGILVDNESSAMSFNAAETGEVEAYRQGFAFAGLLRPENPDLLHLLKAANCFVETDLQEAFIASLNEPSVSLDLLKLLNVIDKATLDSAARINKLVKEGTIELSQGTEALTGIQKGEIKHADLTKALGLDKAKPKAKPKRKR